MSGGRVYPRVLFAVDRGGTFTDIMATVTEADGTQRTETHKLLSRSPDYDDAPSRGIREMLTTIVGEEKATTTTSGGKVLINTAHVDGIRMGTTIATNALLESKGVRSALLVTKGFEDLLRIGTQARPDLFALNIKKRKPVSEVTVEVAERVRVLRADETEEQRLFDGEIVTGQSGEKIQIIAPLDEAAVRVQLKDIRAKGIDSLAVSLMHGHTFTQHEERIAVIAKEEGFTHTSLSSQLMPMVKYVPRTTTASVDAYLTPLLTSYVANFKSKFDSFDATELLFMQSDGGLTSAEGFHGFRAVLSGPAGGVVGFSTSVTEELGEVPMVGFDMGGTSTDVSRCDGRQVEHVVEAEVAGVTLQAPQLDIHTVAAGGGSILSWENGMYKVGPESAGALPGPACYGRGGPLTVTDANMILGRVFTENFPSVFGKSGKERLDMDAPKQLFQKLAAEVSKDLGKERSVEEVALGFLTVANEAMSRPIRAITEAKGHRPADHVLAVFGGAGGQHGCAVAEKLGIQRVVVPKHASVLSAAGIGWAETVEDVQMPASYIIPVDTANDTVVQQELEQHLTTLQTQASAVLERGGFAPSEIRVSRFVNMRFDGTTTAMMIPADHQGESGGASRVLDLPALKERFSAAYGKQFGFTLSKRTIKIDDLRVRATAAHRTEATQSKGNPASAPTTTASSGNETSKKTTQTFFEVGGWTNVPVVDTSLVGASTVQGPALLLLRGSTVVVEPNSTAEISTLGNIVIRTSAQPQKISVDLDPLPLSVFAHRFMSIAEQMGVALQRTALSTNIKERYDFSCGLFDPEGNLVANAPHIPVHLGAMGRAIAAQRALLGDNWKEGDVLVTNDPSMGGSHLPDITVITPCWYDGRPVFYIASRGHHSDIGGSTPGSMPPFSRTIEEEGAIIRSFKLVEGGEFQEEGITQILMSPAKIPGLSGCRALVDVLSDLKAQVAANNRGVELVNQLIQSVGIDVVEAYMGHIQDVAEQSIRKVLKGLASKYGKVLTAEDAMDDGTTIKATITIDAETGGATFDWSDCGLQVAGSTNCPGAVVRSAILYSLRCLIGQDIPLNEGAMRPITVITKPSTILSPQPHLPVVGGNVLTSQRITDVILYAMKALACSQGDMNNFTFGNDRFAYYETIAGGSGAGPGFDGASAVQTHMTNTRITDPEIMESRYPLLLLDFSVRSHSGGAGQWRGGDGVRRHILFLEKVAAVILSERRTLQPRGLEGGGPAQRGLNLLYTRNPDPEAQRRRREGGANLWALEEERVVNIGAKNSIDVQRGEAVVILTPGGGGYGSAA